MELVAHSSPKHALDRLPHGYRAHIMEMLMFAKPLAQQMLAYYPEETARELWWQSLIIAIELHDLGKVDDGNQRILSGEQTGRLPVDHIDSGVAIALQLQNQLAAWLIRAHHAPGLACYVSEKKLSRKLKKQGCLTLLRGSRYKRDDIDSIDTHLEQIHATDKVSSEYHQRHQAVMEHSLRVVEADLPDNALTTRLLLSCLVDADHSSAAAYSQNTMMPTAKASTRWAERLDQLNTYVKGLVTNNAPVDERNQLRQYFYQHCLETPTPRPDGRIISCSAPVGLGKTTSVMAYVLRVANQHQARRIFVVAPFTNVISQTVKALRKALVLSDETDTDVIVEHHHKADFSNKDLRDYAATWRAPVVITTAVQFFETLASALPTPLRKAHHIAGSIIIFDESHAMLPPHLLELAWHWLKQLADNWGCHVIMSSGSVVKFWEREALVANHQTTIPELLSHELLETAQRCETDRVAFAKLSTQALNKNNFLDKVLEQTHTDQSVLIILNTVETTAYIAHALNSRVHPECDEKSSLQKRVVLHVSTALAPIHREAVIDEVIRRQGCSEWDNRRWFLVATSCVEAGVDFDFRIGFRECCSVTSFLQIAGRVNRHGRYNDSVLYDFKLIANAADGVFEHPGMKTSREVFESFWEDLNDASLSLADLSTQALCREVMMTSKANSQLIADESKHNYQAVQKNFKVIESETYTVVICKKLIDKIDKGERVPWQEIQKHSIQLWPNKMLKYNVQQSDLTPELSTWPRRYDEHFLGYMLDIVDDKSVL